MGVSKQLYLTAAPGKDKQKLKGCSFWKKGLKGKKQGGLVLGEGSFFHLKRTHSRRKTKVLPLGKKEKGPIQVSSEEWGTARLSSMRHALFTRKGID